MNKSIAELTSQTLPELCAAVQIEAQYKGRKQLTEGGDSKEWEHDAWIVALTYQGRTYSDIAYRMGTGNSAPATYPDGALGMQPVRDWKPTPPTPADVLSSLLMDVSGLDEGFEDWASSLGYDADSRKADGIYRACLETLPKLHALLGPDFGRFETAAQEY